MKKSFISRIVFTILFALIVYYFMLPPFNLHAFEFYVFVILIVGFYMVISIPSFFGSLLRGVRVKNDSKILKYGICGIFAIIPLIFIVNFVLSPLFNSKAYYNRIAINEEGNFDEEVSEVDFNHIPLLDKDSSRKLGDRVMGQMTDLVSQFYVSDLYTQINYNNEIVRVTPLEYSGVIKYFTNRKEGVPAYITVNSVDGKSTLTKLDKGMRYMPSGLFFENLYRKLRLEYPTVIFGSENFEIDNEGNPYWIVPTIKYTGVGLRKEISGVIIFDPVTGKSARYDSKDVPSWVDHVYDADVIIEQVDDWGRYKNGFFNSLFGQKNVVATTQGYNYTIMNDDVYLYTGITSVVSDESNIGFILTNMRTKETTFYEIPGAEEYSAMASAEGQVQQMNYNASFPLLINFNGKPTYLLSLKDAAGLVKMYAFVDVKDYQKVVVTDASKGIEVAASNYLGDDKVVDEESLITESITISDKTSVVIDGNTYYYFKDSEDNMYYASIKINKQLPFISGKVNVTYEKTDGIRTVIKLEK